MASLHDRSFKARLAFAYMADAYHDFAECTPGSTLDRYLTEGMHPYKRMWNRIQGMYDYMKDREGVRLSELSATEFLHFCQTATQLGFTYQGSNVDASKVRSKAAAWSKRGWFRYEEKRAQKIGYAKKGATFAALILFSPFNM